MSVRVFKDVLPHGLKVVTVETPHLHSALAAVYVRVGSRHESRRTNGVSHLLEHLFFRGSHDFPDSVEMNARVEAVGGNLNGVTMRDSSYFYTPAHPDGLPVALTILGDMLSRPRLTELATEKRIILEEMLDEVDEKGRDIDPDNLSKRLLYGGHPLSFKIAGTPATVRALTDADVRAHFRSAYTARNMVVAVAGPVRRAAVVKQARRAFSRVPAGQALAERPPASPLGPGFTYVVLDESQVEFRLAFPTVPEDHPDHHPLAMLRRVLDDGLSSRLPHEVVEKRGLAYSVGAALEVFHDTGSFEVDGACAPARLGPVVETVLSLLAGFRTALVPRAELGRAQHRHRIHLDFLRDSPGELCGWFGGTELFRPAESFAARAAAADRVRPVHVREVARKYLTASQLTFVGVGPRSAEAPVRRVLHRAAALLDGARPRGR